MQYATEFRVDVKTREQAAYEALRSAITQGRWADGEPLVGSRIATELGVSRITVANAFKRLSAEGFIKLVPHKEAIVAPLDRNDIRQIYLMRAELEALSAREGAVRVTPADLDELNAINDELGSLETAAEPDMRLLRGVDIQFHRRLRRLSGMPMLTSTLDNLADQGEGYRARLLDTRYLVIPTAERHEPIIAAFATHDPDRAADAMRTHVYQGLDAFMELLGANDGSHPAH
jgi:DNA-binding GntR family transcriptional regulator